MFAAVEYQIRYSNNLAIASIGTKGIHCWLIVIASLSTSWWRTFAFSIAWIVYQPYIEKFHHVVNLRKTNHTTLSYLYKYFGFICKRIIWFSIWHHCKVQFIATLNINVYHYKVFMKMHITLLSITHRYLHETQVYVKAYNET